MSITIERRERAFKEALTFGEFIAAMEVNRELFEANYVAYDLSETDKAFFASLEAPVEVLVLAHDWCGDVVANLPLFGKIERETGKLRLHILLRDPDNTDIAAAYPHPDGRNHIPTYVFFSQRGKELGVFIERPEAITALQSGWRQTFFENHLEFEGQNKPLSEMDAAVKTAFLAYLRQQRRDNLALEQTAILEAIKPIIGQPAITLS